MVRRPRDKTRLQLTEVELELMSILWARSGGTVRDVLAGSSRTLAYTSVSTMLRILEQKGVVSSRKQGQSHVYVPNLSRNEYEATALSCFVSTYFGNVPRALVARLIDGNQLTHDDLLALKHQLDARLAGPVPGDARPSPNAMSQGEAKC